MWFGITYLTKDETGGEDDEVIVSVWAADGPFRVGGPARSAADIICALRQAGGRATATPRCDACGGEFDVPDFDAHEQVPA